MMGLLTGGLIVAAALAGLVVVSSASAGTYGPGFNIDYADGAGIPAPTYAAAGDAGFWNVFIAGDPEGVPLPLSDDLGDKSDVTVTHTNLDFFVTPGSGVGGADAALLGDYAGSIGPPFVLDFANLPNGDYAVHTYMATRQDFPAAQTATINDDPTTDATTTTTGVWSGSFVEGEIFTRHDVTVTDGTLRLTISDGNDPILNGVQLVRTPEPTTASALLVLGLTALTRGRNRRGTDL